MSISIRYTTILPNEKTPAKPNAAAVVQVCCCFVFAGLKVIIIITELVVEQLM